MKKKVEEIKNIIDIHRNEFENFEAFDADNNKMIAVTQKVYEEFWEEYENIKNYTLQIAKSLHNIHSKSLYVAVKCNTFMEFCERIGFSPRSVQRYARIGERISPLIENESDSAVASLGATKMYELTKFTQEQLGTLFKGGYIFNGGEEFSLKNAQEMSSRELAEKTARMVNSKDLSKSAYKEEIALKAEENKALQKRNEELEQQKKIGRELELKYGEKEKTVQDKKELLREASDHLSAFFVTITAAGIQEDEDSDIVLNELRKVVSDLSIWQQNSDWKMYQYITNISQ